MPSEKDLRMPASLRDLIRAIQRGGGAGKPKPKG